MASINVRMSNGFLRSGFAVAEKMSPTVSKSTPSTTWGTSRTSRSGGSFVVAGRGHRSPGARYVSSWCSNSTAAAAARLGAQYCASPFGPITRP